MSAKDDNPDNRSLVEYFYAGDDHRPSATLIGADENSLGGDEDVYARYEPVKKKRDWSWMWTSQWWPAWWGLIQFVVLVMVTYVGYRGSLLPGTWVKNPGDGWDSETVIAFIILFIFTWLLIIPGFVDTAIEKGDKWTLKRGTALTLEMLAAFFVLSLIAFFAFVLGSQEQMANEGFGNELWAIVIGMLLCNGLSLCGIPLPKVLDIGAKSGETFVKVGLILLGIDIQTLGALGAPALVVAIPVTAMCIANGFFWARKIVPPQQRKMAMCLVGGTSVCGNSAATAVQTTIGAGPEDLTVAISILSIWTIIQMLVVPPVAELFIPKKVIAAAIGGSINSTGPVVAAASFLRDENGDNKNFVTIASTVKLIQNSMIGFVAVGIAVYWANYEEQFGMVSQGSYHPPNEKQHAGAETVKENDSAKDNPKQSDFDKHSTNISQITFNSKLLHKSYKHSQVSASMISRQTTTTATEFLEGRDPNRPKWWELLWMKFPKFVLMFLFLSLILTIIRAADTNGGEDALRALMGDASKWWFTLGFAGIGLKAQFSSLYKSLLRGAPDKMTTYERFVFVTRPILVYWVTQSFNIVITYAVAYSLFFNFDIGKLA